MSSPFDDIVVTQQLSEEEKRKHEEFHNKLDGLIYHVFNNDPKGKELFELWRDALILTPTVTVNSTQFQAGIEEGKKTFIRSIELTIKKQQEIK